MSNAAAPSPPPSVAATPAPTSASLQFGRIVLDISNSVLPLATLSGLTPSQKDGLSQETEMQVRSLGCDLIQLAGKLLKLPQVAMATGCVLFQRFYYAKSLIRLPFDIVAMACVGLASKIEESPRRARDIINVFKHIKQVRSGKPIQPVVLDQHYIALKNQVIKAERRVLKELGFCVHVKHPHKIIIMYLRWLDLDTNRQLIQMSWNFMNDSLRTDVFVRYPPELIAVACIYLSARKLRVALPRQPAWFECLGVEEDDIKDCCYRMICLYNRAKPNQEDLETTIDTLRRQIDATRKAAREQGSSAAGTGSNTAAGTPTNAGSPTSRAATPQHSAGAAGAKNGSESQQQREGEANGKNRRREDSRSPGGGGQLKQLQPEENYSKSRKKKHRRSRSRSSSYERSEKRERSSKKSSKKHRRSEEARSPGYALTPPKKSKKLHKEKIRYRSRSRDRSAPYDYRDGGKSSNGAGRSSSSSYYDKYGGGVGGRDYGGKKHSGGSGSGKRSSGNSREDYYAGAGRR